MDTSTYQRDVMPVFMRLYPRLFKQVSQNQDLLASWARVCGNHGLARVQACLQEMRDELPTDFPMPAQLRTKLMIPAKADGSTIHDPKAAAKAEKAAWDEHWKEIDDLLEGVSESDLVEHYLHACAATAHTEGFAADAVDHPAFRAACSRRIAFGLRPDDLLHYVPKGWIDPDYEPTAGEAPVIDAIEVKPEAVERCREIRNQRIRHKIPKEKRSPLEILESVIVKAPDYGPPAKDAWAIAKEAQQLREQEAKHAVFHPPGFGPVPQAKTSAPRVIPAAPVPPPPMDP